MADKAHRLTDEKLEEMESGCLPFIRTKGDLILKSDVVYRKTKRQILKEYN